MREVGPWTLCEGGAGAYRALVGKDGENIANRVAFIEKTPRIRIRGATGLFVGDRLVVSSEDFLNWASGPIKGEALELFGFHVLDPAKANWRA